MGQQAKENIKRLFGKSAQYSTPESDADLITKGYSTAGISGSITGAQGVTVVGGASSAIVVGLGTITPPYASITTLKAVNQTTVSGLTATGGVSMVTAAVINNVSLSGIIVTKAAVGSGAPPASIGNAPAGASSPMTASGYLPITIDGLTGYIPVFVV